MARLELLTTAYGHAALTELARTVSRAKDAGLLDPVTVVVPTDAVGVSARRFLAEQGRGVAAVTITTLRRLAEQLGADELARQGRRPLQQSLVLAALRRELTREPGVFAAVAHHRATDEALLATDRELSGLRSDDLARLAAMSPMAADVVRLHRTTRRHLSRSWFDEADLLTAARAALAAGSLDGAGPLVIFLPQQLAPRWREFLADVANARPTTVIAGVTDASDADDEVRQVLAALRLDLGAFSFTTIPSIEEHTASDADDEVRVALRILTDAPALVLARCAVLYPSAVPYARLISDHLDAAGIAWNGPSPGTLGQTVLGRAVEGVLHLAAASGRIERNQLFDILATAPVRHDGHPVPVGEWERVARAAGIHDGDASHWSERLTRWRTARGRYPGQVRSALDLAEFVENLAGSIDRLRASRSWLDFSGHLRRTCATALGSEQIRATWPKAEQLAADAFDAALDALASLDHVDPKPELSRFDRAVRHVLEAPAPRHGRIGEGVLVGPLSSAVGLELDLIVVVGAAEGLLPHVPSDDPVIPDVARRRAQLPTTDDRIARQHREFLAALSSGRRIIVCRPRGDLRQTVARTRSRWLDALPIADLVDHPSFAHGVAEPMAIATPQEYRLRGLVRRELIRQTDHAFHQAKRLLEGRAAVGLTAFDGDVSAVAHLLPDPLVAPVAPTRLESWVVCPHAFFMRHVLQVHEIEDPAQRLSISPIDEGVLMHIVLDRFVQTFLPTNDRPDWTDPANLDLMLSLFDAACIEAERDGRTGRAVFWNYDRLRMQRDLGRFLLADAADMERRASMPLAAEFEFGAGGRPAATLTLPDGRVARFTGKVDRVDRTRFKQLIVTDYKTGGAHGYTNLSQENPHANGRFLQLPVYAAAALAAFPDSNPGNVLTRYEFISERAALGRRPPPIVIDDDVTQSVNEALSVILDGLTAGLFPARPDPTTRGNYVPCAYCEPDGLGVTELHRAWLTKRSDERLAAYCRMLGEGLDDALDTLADEESGQ